VGFDLEITKAPSFKNLKSFFSWTKATKRIIEQIHTYYSRRSHNLSELFSQLKQSQVAMYNTNGFGTETMYDYYIVIKSLFLVVKLFSHPSIVFASFTIFLPWTKHKQHQNHSKPKAFKKKQNFNSNKLCIHTIILYKWRCLSRS
jgi:hypothetical protein